MVKKSFMRLPLLAVVVVIVLTISNCAMLANLFNSGSWVETETSQEIYDAATDLVLSRGDGILPDMFETGLKRKFSGLTINNRTEYSGTDQRDLELNYKGKKYTLRMSPMARYTSVDLCKEYVPREKK